MDKWHLITLSQWTSRICGAGLLLLATLIIIQTIQEGNLRLDGIVIAGILFFLGLGLIKCWNKAKQLLAAVLLFSAIITPIGIINPFHAGDQIALHGEAPAIAEILIWLVPLEIGLLAFAWLLDLPFKKEA